MLIIMNVFHYVACVPIVFLFVLSFPASCMAATPNPNDTCHLLCSGEILKHVQLAKVFNESKYFVDMKLMDDPTIIKSKFDQLLKEKGGHLEPTVVKSFVEEWFGPPGSDLEQVQPDDWVPEPNFIDEIYDIKLRKWLTDLNGVWKQLLRKTPEEVKTNSQSYSQIYLPHPFIVPGGRFREMYYWDTYWIVEGLLLCQMPTTAKHMIKNLLHLIDTYGYVPNGSRKYYLGRSQPPFLTPTLELYYQYTGDFDIIRDNLHLLDKEFHYWVNSSTVSFKYKSMEYSLFQYAVNSTEPRPESYYEDFTAAQNLSKSQRKHFYSNVKAAAESGWDFSSRWFVVNGSRSNSLEDINTHSIVPVDLNTLMGYNAQILASYYKKIGNTTKYEQYNQWATNMNHTVSRLFWDDDEGIWLDFNLDTMEPQKGYYASSFMPLWTKTYGLERNNSYVISKVIDFIVKNDLEKYPGGFPTSLNKSEQQWDLPNGWAPLHHLIILGLNDASVYNETAGKMAADLASKWVLNNYYSYSNSSPHHMLEKYDVTRVGTPGSGGEYPIQDGFGWTNGVVMKLMHTFPHKILTDHTISYVPVYIAVLLFLITSITLLLYCYKMYCFTKEGIEFDDSLLEEQQELVVSDE